MPRLTLSVIPIKARPANHPLPTLLKVWPALERHLRHNVGPMLVRDMEATVDNWNTKPDMVQAVTRPYGTRLQLTVEPKGKGSTNWRRISVGTGPRTIRARTPRGMHFQTGYAPKTTPGGRYGGSGKRSGPWRRGVMRVSRHRIEPRQFSKKIMARREKQIRNGIVALVRVISIVNRGNI